MLHKVTMKQGKIWHFEVSDDSKKSSLFEFTKKCASQTKVPPGENPCCACATGSLI
jgi:hypothetical protein